jgi:diketogulonate reductase-like aldo/keto reductase
MKQSIDVRGIAVPAFLYGTAWKEERTDALVRQALAAGFRAIDTANQRKHYFEAGVGAAIEASRVPRGELFLQTKFTYQRGQDQRLPYDPTAPLATQVRQSVESSLQHLRVELIDSLVLHGPWAASGWTKQDQETWRAMESLQAGAQVRLLGISNTSLDQLIAVCDTHDVTPAFVQNRCYARTGWDREVRAVCRDRGIVYQPFSLLTANARELASATARSIAARLRVTVPQLVFSFASSSGMLPLTGTSNVEHMRQDLVSTAIELSSADRNAIENLATS